MTAVSLLILVATAGADIEREAREEAVVAQLKKVGDVFVTKGLPERKEYGIIGIDFRLTGVRKASDVISALKQLARLPRLRTVMLVGSSFDDEAMGAIAALGDLEDLQLYNTQITDKGVNKLTTLSKLKRLVFSGPTLTDRGLRSVARLTSLQYLELNDAPITDAGLMLLSPLTQLQRLIVSNGHVTDDGIIDLRRTLPTIRFGERFGR